MSDENQTTEVVSFPATAVICLNGWAGFVEYPVTVTGETPKKYRIKADARTRLAGRLRWLEPGESALVPKYAVRFT